MRSPSISLFIALRESNFFFSFFITPAVRERGVGGWTASELLLFLKTICELRRRTAVYRKLRTAAACDGSGDGGGDGGGYDDGDDDDDDDDDADSPGVCAGPSES